MSKPIVKIYYCTKCRWLTRASWVAQEFLNTFADELGEVALCPGVASGQFDIELNGELIWSRKQAGGFTELGDIKLLKQRIRNRIAPDKDLGHSDKPDRECPL